MVDRRRAIRHHRRRTPTPRPHDSLGAIRAKRYRDRRAEGIRALAFRSASRLLPFCIEDGVLTASRERDSAAIERAITPCVKRVASDVLRRRPRSCRGERGGSGRHATTTM